MRAKTDTDGAGASDFALGAPQRTAASDRAHSDLRFLAQRFCGLEGLTQATAEADFALVDVCLRAAGIVLTVEQFEAEIEG